MRPGDRLRVGPVTFVVEYQLTPEAIDRLLRGEGVESVEEDLEVVEEGRGPSWCSMRTGCCRWRAGRGRGG